MPPACSHIFNLHNNYSSSLISLLFYFHIFPDRIDILEPNVSITLSYCKHFKWTLSVCLHWLVSTLHKQISPADFTSSSAEVTACSPLIYWLPVQLKMSIFFSTSLCTHILQVLGVSRAFVPPPPGIEIDNLPSDCPRTSTALILNFI